MSIYCLFIFRYNWRQMYNYYSIQEQWITVLHVSWTSSSLWVGQSSINSSTYILTSNGVPNQVVSLQWRLPVACRWQYVLLRLRDEVRQDAS